jgi:hypothetical protein
MAIATPLTHDPAAAVPVADAAARLRLRDGTAVTLRTSEAGTAGDERATISAQAEGRTVGAVSYARVYGPRAVLTIELEDGFWHRGLPELLLTALCARAAQLGIATFLMRVPAGDVRLLALLRERCGARIGRDGAFVDVEFAVPPRCAQPGTIML